MKWSKAWNVPLFLFLLAFITRVWGATISPPSLYWEEVALGYDAYSILKTGKDHLGNAFPLVAFPSFGDYKPSLYFYSLVPSVAVFGLTPFAIRFPALFASSLTVVFAFLLMKRWTNPQVAFWTGVLLLFQPWNWQVGKVGFEVNLATSLIFGGVWLLQKAVDLWNKRESTFFTHFFLYSSFSTLCLALSLYAYHGARVLAPIFGVAVLLWQTRWWRFFLEWRRWLAWIPSLGIALLILIPLMLSLGSAATTQRWNETSLFSDTAPAIEAIELRESSHNTILSRVFYHPKLFRTWQLAEGYLNHLAPAFLFLQGDENSRHTSQYFGALYPWEVITLLLGALWGTRFFREKKQLMLFFSLLLLSPVPAMLTRATPHALRTLPLSLLLAMLSGMGMVVVIQFLEKQRDRLRSRVSSKTLSTWYPKIPHVLAFFLIVVSWLILRFTFFGYYRIHYASDWQYGYKQLYDTLLQEKRPEEPVYISRAYGRPAMYLFFFGAIDPRRVQAAAQTAPKDQQELLVFEEWSFIDGQSLNAGLHAYPADSDLSSYEPVTVIRDLADEPIWYIVRHP